MTLSTLGKLLFLIASAVVGAWLRRFLRRHSGF